MGALKPKLPVKGEFTVNDQGLACTWAAHRPNALREARVKYPLKGCAETKEKGLHFGGLKGIRPGTCSPEVFCKSGLSRCKRGIRVRSGNYFEKISPIYLQIGACRFSLAFACRRLRDLLRQCLHIPQDGTTADSQGLRQVIVGRRCTLVPGLLE
jgi:hypothetical protein